MPTTTTKPIVTKKKAIVKHSKKTTAPTVVTDANTGNLKPVEKKVLGTLALFRDVFNVKDGVPRHHVALYSGYEKKTTPGFVKVLGVLKKKNMIEYPDKQSIRLTPAGIQAAGPVLYPPSSNTDIHDHLKAAFLKPAEIRVFDYCITAASVVAPADNSNGGGDGNNGNLSNTISKEQIANGLKYKSATQPGFVKVLGKLKTLGIVEYPTKTTVKCVDNIVFPFGLSSPDTTTTTTTTAITTIQTAAVAETSANSNNIIEIES